MADHLDRTDLIHQLEQLKQGLSSILEKGATLPEAPEIDTNGLPSQDSPPHIEDHALLENFEIINTSKEMLKYSSETPAMVKHGNQSLLLLDSQSNIMAFNRTAEAHLPGLTGVQLSIGVSIYDLLPVEDIRDFKSMIQYVLAGHTMHVTRKMMFEVEEVWYEINMFPVKDRQQNIGKVVFGLEDIKERKKAQANLKALEINFQSVFKQAAVSVMLTNTELRVIQANQKFYQMVEYSAEEYKALPPWSITHPRDIAESQRLTELLLNGEVDSFSLEKRYITKTGKILWVYLTSNIIKDQKGQPKLIISVAQDITDRKHAEQELIYKTNELDTFVYRASHDLRGPVASLMGLYNVVQSEFKDDEHALEYFEHYHRSVLRLNRILHNLIDLTKIKEKEIQPSKVDLKALLNDCLSSLSHVTNFEKIHFKVQNEVDFEVLTDKGLLHTIVYNLLENSINFIQPDNSQPFVKVNLKYESNFLIMEVADNGQGIKKELQSEVFNMFYRANERSTGSGLGLYIVRNAVERLNGNIQLKSKEYSGTKISIYIPYMHKSAQAPLGTN